MSVTGIKLNFMVAHLTDDRASFFFFFEYFLHLNRIGGENRERICFQGG